MLALAAGDETSEPLPESVSALQAATQSMRLVDVVDGVGCGSLEYSPDGALVAVDRAEGQPNCPAHRSIERRRVGRGGDSNTHSA